jgi:ubiquinone/menaquinone biosynthesis C-methylase UbiE
MELQAAIDLINTPLLDTSNPQIWADLGCGDGTFTTALASLLAPESVIHAVDKNRRALRQLPAVFSEVNIQPRQANFVVDALPFYHLDGIIMANSLHYVARQAVFVSQIRKLLKPDGSLLVVEYDTKASNLWVPYHLAFDQLADLFLPAGFSTIQKLGTRNSIYRRGEIYAAWIGL